MNEYRARHDRLTGRTKRPAKLGGFLPPPPPAAPRDPARQFVGWKATAGVLALGGLVLAIGAAPIIGVALLIAGLVVYGTGQLLRSLR